ncbi:MAG TPA: hypothetical protein VD902_05020 [Symbiobacteriaceae bacterium]|nr:hypothetical protein [Symbiobacteriaceae bacterium]
MAERLVQQEQRSPIEEFISGIPISSPYSIRFREGVCLWGGILRADGSVVLPSGSDVLMPGDRVVVLALPQARPVIDKLFCVRGPGVAAASARRGG